MSPAESAVSTRARILTATEDLIARQGFAATTIAQICKRSGLPNGSVYYQFRTKAEILAAVIDRGDDEILTALRQASVPDIDAFYDAAAEVLLRELPWFRVLMMMVLERIDDEVVQASLKRLRRDLNAVLADVLTGYTRAAGIEATDELVTRLVELTIAISRGAIASETFSPEMFRSVMRDNGLVVKLLIDHASRPA